MSWWSRIRNSAETYPVIARHVASGQRSPVLLPVSNPQSAAGLARLAARIAALSNTSVILLYVVRQRGVSQPLPEEPDDPSSWPALRIALDSLAEAGVTAGWIVRIADNIGRAIRLTARELRARSVILGWRGRITSDGTHIHATLADILEDPTADIIVLGGEPPTQLRRILAPLASGPHAHLALELAAKLSHGDAAARANDGGQVTALHVVSSGEHGITGSTVRRLRRHLGRYAKYASLRSKIVSAEDTAEAILAELETGYDAVIIGTSREGLIDRLLFGDVPQRVADESDVSVLVVRRHARPTTRIARNAWQAVTDFLPTLTDDDREAVHRTIREGARSRVDFFIMIGLAALLAALGLLLDSPAVIIGAMLVAPLMSAIVGLGLGMVEGDTQLLKDAALASLRGMFIAMFVGAAVGLLMPATAPTPEILSRTRPNVLDLGVALASGAAAAYAICRKDVSAALAGVAIAAALVPPLATVGIGISLGNGSIAGGALLLFVTNLISIAAAGGLIFLLLGFAPPETQKQKRNILRRGLSGALIMTGAMTLILGWLTVSSIRTTQTNQSIERAVRAQVAALQDAELDRFEYHWQEDGTLQIVLSVRSTRQLSYSTVTAIQREVATALQKPVALLLTVIPTTRLDPLVPPTFTPAPTSAPTEAARPTATATEATSVPENATVAPSASEPTAGPITPIMDTATPPSTAKTVPSPTPSVTLTAASTTPAVEATAVTSG